MYIEIKTDRLLIRSMTSKDVETTYAYQGDEELTKYMLYMPDESIEVTAEFIRGIEEEQNGNNPKRFEMIVLLENEHIGGVSIYIEEDDPKVGELGWLIKKEFQGKGYITEAAKALMEYSFENLGLEKIYARCDSRNIASEKVMKKLEMFLEEEGKRFYKKRNEEAGEYKYSIFRKK